MLAFTAPTPMAWVAAVTESTLTAFGTLSRLHADGWGTAQLHDVGATRVVTARGTAGRYDDEADLGVRNASPAAAAMLYLRFASSGAAVSPENVQPFVRDGVAFQHNGALSPRERLMAGLTRGEQTALRGTTDSEVYFAHAVRRGIHSDPHDALVATARAVREVFPEACLNAIVLHPLGLHVVHSAGTAPLPLESFARRGFSADTLPAGHDEHYNVLSRTVTPAGATVIATTGVDQHDWEPLPADAVTAIAPSGALRTVML